GPQSRAHSRRPIHHNPDFPVGNYPLNPPKLRFVNEIFHLPANIYKRWATHNPSGGPAKSTRFRPLSMDQPKPLFSIGGYPIIYHHVEACSKVPGMKEILLIGYYPREQFWPFFRRMPTAIWYQDSLPARVHFPRWGHRGPSTLSNQCSESVHMEKEVFQPLPASTACFAYVTKRFWSQVKSAGASVSPTAVLGPNVSYRSVRQPLVRASACGDCSIVLQGGVIREHACVMFSAVNRHRGQHRRMGPNRGAHGTMRPIRIRINPFAKIKTRLRN
uniref:NTP_transferase domain-containing protein n=1 Tax=Macrostomum lignano TaxID=282301 RepID=A0A1I8JR52_9PLAT